MRRGRVGRGLGSLLMLVLALPGCTGPAGGEDCEGAAVLAAGAAVATSCSPPGVSFRGRVYAVSCKRVHEDWIGEVLVPHGGHTRYDEARSLRGVDPADAFVLVRHGSPCRLSVAVGARPGELPDFARPPYPVLDVRPSSARSGDVLTVVLKVSDDYVYGVEAKLVVVGEPTSRARMLVESLTTGRLKVIRPGPRTGIPSIGFVGSRTWELRLPDLPPGRYEIRKELIAEEPEGAPAAQRSVVVRARFGIKR